MPSRWSAIVVSIVVAACAQAADDGVVRLQRMLDETRTVDATFTQTIGDEKQKTLKESNGSLALSRPGRFRWDYQAPHPQTIVSDGKRLWIYDPELNQASVKPLDGNIATSPAALLGGAGKLSDSFVATDQGSADGLNWIELVPKVKDSEFERVRLGLGARFVETMELTDAFGQTTRIKLLKVTLNGALDAKRFEFHPPAGADVVGDAGKDR